MQLLLTKVALYAWPLVVLYLFKRLPAHRAVIAGVVAGTLFLPEVQIAKVSDEAPDANGFVVLVLKFTKPNTICFAVLLGAVLFDGKRLLSFRPRWFDLPIFFYCLCPYIANLNNGVGAYDAFSMMRDKILMWGVPYALGRVYCNTLENFRDLAIGIVLGGLVYAPLCLWESRMFPNLHENLYGFFPGPKDEVTRWGGFRPVVFLSHGIMLGLWMVATTVVAFWLWFTGAVTELTVWPFRRPIAMTKLLLFLGLTTLWVRSTGAIGLGVACVLGILQMRWVKFPLVLTVLLAFSPLYLLVRTAGWTGDDFVKALGDGGMPDDRLESLKYRLHMENRLILKYREQPDFGWGDFNPKWRRAPKLKPVDYDDAVADALWIITLTQLGRFGLGALWLAMLLPVVRFLLVHPPRLWFNPALAPAAAAALVLILYMNDNLFNAFYNPVFVLSAGGLAGLTGVRLPRPAPVEVEPEDETPSEPTPPSPPEARRPGVLVRRRALR
jgi:hypothetical protein